MDWIPSGSLKGPQGDPGPQGPQGVQGQPGADGAQLEASKQWAKALMQEAGVPTAGYWPATSREQALAQVGERQEALEVLTRAGAQEISQGSFWLALGARREDRSGHGPHTGVPRRGRR